MPWVAYSQQELCRELRSPPLRTGVEFEVCEISLRFAMIRD